MLYTMLCLVLLVFTLTRCRGDSDNSSMSPMLLQPPVPASHRIFAAQVNSLRRQLMRDNYDYQHSGDERQPNITTRSGGDTTFYYQKGGTDHLPRASELAQANSNEFSAESVQQDQSKQLGQFEQRGQHEHGQQQNQPGEYEPRGQHEQHNQHKQGRHHKQLDEYEHRRQYEQPSEHEQHGQYQQPGEHEQRGLYNQHDRYEQHGPHKQREQREQRGQNEPRGAHEQRGQNEQREHSEQQEQIEQYDEEEQAQSIEHKHRAVPSLDDAPPVAIPFTDELTVRKYTSEWRDIRPEQAQEYNPSYYNKKRDAYYPPYPAMMERRPFSDLRGNYKEQYGQNDAGNAQESPDQEYTPDEQEAFDQQDTSETQNDEGSDFSESKKQAKLYNEFAMHSTTRANRLQYYTPAPDERNAPPPHRMHNSLNYRVHNTPLHRSRNAPPAHRNAPPLHRSAPPPHRKAPNHNISKMDLLYYMDDSQLRRRNNVPDEDQPADEQLPSPQPSPSPNSVGTRTSPGKPARRPAPTEGELPRTSRARRSFVVTVSEDNVTYKLLTLKSRSGRRQDERRILEERGPAGVAIMSLDHAPLPAFRLPRARRQYMQAPHHHRRHEPA